MVLALPEITNASVIIFVVAVIVSCPLSPRGENWLSVPVIGAGKRYRYPPYFSPCEWSGVFLSDVSPNNCRGLTASRIASITFRRHMFSITPTTPEVSKVHWGILGSNVRPARTQGEEEKGPKRTEFVLKNRIVDSMSWINRPNICHGSCRPRVASFQGP